MDKFGKYRGVVDAVVPEVMTAVVAFGRGFGNLGVREVAVPEIGRGELLGRLGVVRLPVHHS